MKTLKRSLIGVLVLIVILAGFAGCDSNKPPTTVVGFNLTQMTSDIKALNDKAAIFTSDIAAIKASISALPPAGVSQTDFNALKTRVDALETNAKSLDVTLNTLTVKVNAIPADLVIDAELQAAKNGLQTNIDAVKASVAAMTATVTGLQTSVTALQASVAGLPTAAQFTAMQASVTALQTSLAALTTKVNGMVIPVGLKVRLVTVDAGSVAAVSDVAGSYPVVFSVYGTTDDINAVVVAADDGIIIFRSATQDAQLITQNYTAGKASFYDGQVSVIGNLIGVTKTNWTDALVGGTIRRSTSSNSYDIVAVDQATQTITIAEPYDGTDALNVSYVITYALQSNQYCLTVIVSGAWGIGDSIGIGIDGFEIAAATVTAGL